MLQNIAYQGDSRSQSSSTVCEGKVVAMGIGMPRCLRRERISPMRSSVLQSLDSVILSRVRYFKGRVQEVLGPSLLVCESVTYSPCVLKKLSVFVPRYRRWSISHIIVDLQSDCELYMQELDMKTTGHIGSKRFIFSISGTRDSKFAVLGVSMVERWVC